MIHMCLSLIPRNQCCSMIVILPTHYEPMCCGAREQSLRSSTPRMVTSAAVPTAVFAFSWKISMSLVSTQSPAVRATCMSFAPALSALALDSRQDPSCRSHALKIPLGHSVYGRDTSNTQHHAPWFSYGGLGRKTPPCFTTRLAIAVVLEICVCTSPHKLCSDDHRGFALSSVSHVRPIKW